MANRIALLFAGLALATVSIETATAADACALLSADAIRQATGESVATTKSTAAKSGTLQQSQCFYALPTYANSISVTLTTSAGASRDAVRELWDRLFHESDADESEEKEAAAKPVPVAGIGDEAFWVHSFVGNLYVRKGNRFLRISLGGKLTDELRQARAKALAAVALKRM